MAVAVFFSLVEIGLRIARFEYLPDDTPLVVMRDFQREGYKSLYRFDDQTLWSLVPGAMYAREGNDSEYIDSLGFRGPDFSVNKPANTLRVAVMGDSSAFGLGVQRRYIYTELLREYLKKALPGINVEVINAGVTGYTSTQALAHFRRDVLPLKPDVVAIAVGACNENYDVKHSDAERIAMMKKSAPLRAFRQALLKSRTAQLFLWLAQKVKPQDVSPVTQRATLAQFNKDLEGFAEESAKNHFLLVAISPHRTNKIDKSNPRLMKYTEEIIDFAKRKNLPLVDVHSYFRNMKDDAGLFRDDYHPSRPGHDLIAQMMAYTIAGEVRAGRVPGFGAEKENSKR